MCITSLCMLQQDTTRYELYWSFPICALTGIKNTDVIATPAATNL